MTLGARNTGSPAFLFFHLASWEPLREFPFLSLGFVFPFPLILPFCSVLATGS